MLTGALWNWRTGPSLQLFEHPGTEAEAEKVLIIIGGLTDGLLPCRYVTQLCYEAHKQAGWSTVQPVLSGSYCQYGTGTLDRDVADLSGVIKALKAQRGTKEVAIHGHSTGCQIICHFMKTAAPEIRNMVRLAVLQAPVSDREASPAPDPATLRRAQVLAAAGKGGEIVEVQSQLQHMSTAGQHALAAAAAAAADADGGGAAVNGGVLHAGFTAVLMLSGSDEYAPLASSAATGGGENGDGGGLAAYTAFGEVLAAACGEGAVCKVIEGADHGCSTPAAAAAVVQAVLHDLAGLDAPV
eukprot:gene3830-6951_t